MDESEGTRAAFVMLTIILAIIIYFGADVSGLAGVLVSTIIAAGIAIVLIGGWAIGKNLSK